MRSKNKNLTAFEEVRDQFIPLEGTSERKKHDREFELFMVGVKIAQAREDQGMTQEQLAKMCGTTKAVINKTEMEAENAKISVLRNIIEKGLSGRLEFSVHF